MQVNAPVICGEEMLPSSCGQLKYLKCEIALLCDRVKNDTEFSARHRLDLGDLLRRSLSIVNRSIGPYRHDSLYLLALEQTDVA
jgi:hypothetical protein